MTSKSSSSPLWEVHTRHVEAEASMKERLTWILVTLSTLIVMIPITAYCMTNRLLEAIRQESNMAQRHTLSVVQTPRASDIGSAINAEMTICFVSGSHKLLEDCGESESTEGTGSNSRQMPSEQMRWRIDREDKTIDTCELQKQIDQRVGTSRALLLAIGGHDSQPLAKHAGGGYASNHDLAWSRALHVLNSIRECRGPSNKGPARLSTIPIPGGVQSRHDDNLHAPRVVGTEPTARRVEIQLILGE